MRAFPCTLRGLTAAPFRLTAESMHLGPQLPSLQSGKAEDTIDDHSRYCLACALPHQPGLVGVNMKSFFLNDSASKDAKLVRRLATHDTRKLWNQFGEVTSPFRLRRTGQVAPPVLRRKSWRRRRSSRALFKTRSAGATYRFVCTHRARVHRFSPDCVRIWLSLSRSRTETDRPFQRGGSFGNCAGCGSSCYPGCKPSCFSFSRRVRRERPSQRAALAWLPCASKMACVKTSRSAAART